MRQQGASTSARSTSHGMLFAPGRLLAVLVVTVVASVFAASAAAFGAGPGATPLVSLPSAIGFFDTHHGIIGTAAPPCQPVDMISIPECQHGTILTTDDGGRTTHVVLRPPGPVTSVAVASGGQAWAFSFLCGAAPLCTSGTLYHSSDEGRTWRGLTHLPLVTISFANASDGLGVLGPAVCDPACDPFTSLVATSDGGKTWQRVATPCSRSQFGPQVQSVSQVTRTQAWLLCQGKLSVTRHGSAIHETASKWIYRTDDGARTWKLVLAVKRSAVNGLTSQGEPEGISFADNGFGVLWEQLGSQYLTRDAGRHWQALESVEREDGRFASAFGKRFAFLLLPTHPSTGQQLNSMRLALTTSRGAPLETVRVWRYR
jgi:photosystem II stability/assembly factor-like uncharacterized protein